MAVLFNYFLLGMIIGCLAFFIYISVDKNTLYKALTITGALTILFQFWTFLNVHLYLPENLIAVSLVIYLSAVIISVIGCLLMIKHYINKSSNDYSITALDIVLNGNMASQTLLKQKEELIKQKREFETKENDYKLSLSKIQEELESNNRKLDLEIKSIEEYRAFLHNQEMELKEKEKNINRFIDKEMIIELPIKNEFIMDLDFIKRLRNNFINYTRFVIELYDSTENFLNKFGKNEILTIYGYFQSVCHIICKLVSGSSAGDVRTHVRILKDDEYHVFVSTYGSISNLDEMTIIPKDYMICKAFEKKTSLIGGLNPEYSYKSKNSEAWNEYITIPINNVFGNNINFLSFGISITDNIHINTLKFLNLVKIENILSENISHIHRKYDIIKIINEVKEIDCEKDNKNQ